MKRYICDDESNENNYDENPRVHGPRAGQKLFVWYWYWWWWLLLLRCSSFAQQRFVIVSQDQSTALNQPRHVVPEHAWFSVLVEDENSCWWRGWFHLLAVVVVVIVVVSVRRLSRPRACLVNFERRSWLGVDSWQVCNGHLGDSSSILVSLFLPSWPCA